MYSSRKNGVDWIFSLRAADAFSVVLSFIIAFIASGFIDAVDTPPADRISFLNCCFLGALVLFFCHRIGLYRWDAFIWLAPLLRRLALALLVSAALFSTIRFFVTAKVSLKFLPFLLLFCLVCFVVIVLVRQIVKFVDVRVLRNVRFERIVFLGWSMRLKKVLRAMEHEMRQFHEVQGFLKDESQPDRRPPAELGFKEFGPLADLKALLAANKTTLLLVDQSKVAPETLRKVADLCADALVNLRLIPSTFDIWADRLGIRVLGGVPIIGINELAHDQFESRLLKRLVDIAGAIFGLAISAPVIGILALLIKRESPGPVFFRQTRLGLRGKPFEIIKLRSMRLDAEKTQGAVWAVENDPRRLKIGKFMRELNLDELPQFWNVLVGDMSLVGPRPERPEFVAGFRDSIRYYNLRHTCKPGVTGWAAVHGLRGNTSLEDRLDFDLYYIENWSLALDFKIMLMTLAPPKNAY